MDIMLQKDFGTLSDCIRRDPASWRDIALLYVRPSPDAQTDSFQSALKNAYGDRPVLALRNNAGAYVLIGAAPSNACLADIPGFVFRATDIKRQWREICALLDTKAEDTRRDVGMAEPSVHKSKELSMLIVEDDAMTSQLLEHQLRQYGNVTVTGNYRQAMANYAVTRPDMIFLDIHYKDDNHDGFDAMADIASADPDAFVVMFSGDSDPVTVFRCLSLGAQGFIAKPFRPSDFAHYLARFTHGNG